MRTMHPSIVVLNNVLLLSLAQWMKYLLHIVMEVIAVGQLAVSSKSSFTKVSVEYSS